MMTFETINPSTGEKMQSYAETSAVEVEERLNQAQEAFRAWRLVAPVERTARMKAAAEGLRRKKNEYAHLMACEMGKPVSQGRAEVEKCAGACDYFAENAARFLTPDAVLTDAAKSYVAFEPLGVVLAIMPWNFPFWQVFRCAAPALMAGNAVLLKHAANVPGCALAIEQVLREAEFPKGLFSMLLLSSNRVNQLLDSPAIRAVSLTGSVAAGRAVAAAAGARLKKTVLELGGSDAYVVLEDCDLEPTVECCVSSRLINGGQSCIAAKRFIVMESIREKFETLFVARMEAQSQGDPLLETTTLGPLARGDLRDELHSQVERTLSQGARLLTGGKIRSGKGWYYPPTILTDVREGMPAFQEETFGPVAAITPAHDEAEAIRLANQSSFGLGAAVFTRNRDRGERLAIRELEAGSCFVNDFVRSDARLPFGGIKDSGYGRELSVFGIREFVNVKTVYMK
jgi:succinate-semialdehyde dehydrogenase/glutarate-semialdehyde dehydrogenase